MSPQILSLIVFAENIHLNLNRPTKIAVCAPGFRFKLCYNIKCKYGIISNEKTARVRVFLCWFVKKHTQFVIKDSVPIRCVPILKE